MTKPVQVHEGQGYEPEHLLHVVVREQGDEYEAHHLLIEWQTLRTLRHLKTVTTRASRIKLVCESDGFVWVGISAMLVQDSDQYIVIHVDELKLGTMEKWEPLFKDTDDPEKVKLASQMLENQEKYLRGQS